MRLFDHGFPVRLDDETDMLRACFLYLPNAFERRFALAEREDAALSHGFEHGIRPVRLSREVFKIYPDFALRAAAHFRFKGKARVLRRDKLPRPPFASLSAPFSIAPPSISHEVISLPLKFAVFAGRLKKALAR